MRAPLPIGLFSLMTLHRSYSVCNSAGEQDLVGVDLLNMNMNKTMKEGIAYSKGGLLHEHEGGNRNKRRKDR